MFEICLHYNLLLMRKKILPAAKDAPTATPTLLYDLFVDFINNCASDNPKSQMRSHKLRQIKEKAEVSKNFDIFN